MGYEISKVTDLEPETIHNYHVVSGRANQAKYAIAALKSKMSGLINKEETTIHDDEALLGVDITPSCIYVCQIDNKSAGRTLTSIASVCMPGKFVGEDILNNPDLYSESLKNLIREHKIQTKKVALSLPVSSSIVRVATISKMDDDEISKAVKYGSLWKNLMSKNDSQENYSIFYQVIRRDELSDTMDILLVATKLADINLYKNIVMSSGLMPVVIDAKGLAVHYALKNRNIRDGKEGTLLIEFGLNDNYIMAIGKHSPRIFDMELSAAERSAILGFEASGNTQTLDAIVKKYAQKIHAISYYYNKAETGMAISEVYVMSSLPVIDAFIVKLSETLKHYSVKEYSMVDYLFIEDHFYLKNNNKSNISAWAGSVCMAIFPWHKRCEDWIEIQQSPSFGTVYFHHNDEIDGLHDVSINVGTFEPAQASNKNNKSTLARCASYPNIMALAAAVFSFFMIYNSYHGLIDEKKELASNDVALSTVSVRYQEKTNEISALNSINTKLEGLGQAYVDISKENNQQYVLSMYNYLNTVLQQGVWLKELSFNAPNNIQIDGRSIDDNGAMAFLDTMNGSKMFSKMDLKHIQSIRELDLYAQNSTELKSFHLKGSLSDTLPGEYLKKPNMVAGGMEHGG